jgi:hypothetical protein
MLPSKTYHLIVVIFAGLGSCIPLGSERPECPLVVNGERISAARLMPQNVAEGIIAWNTSEEWAKQPYIMSDGVRKQFAYADMWMWLYTHTECNCVVVGVYPRDERSICAVDQESKDELVDALLALRVRWKGNQVIERAIPPPKHGFMSWE